METVASKIPKPLVDEMDRLVTSGRFANRSEVMRVAVREFLGVKRPSAPQEAGTPDRRIEAFRRRLRGLAADPRCRNRWVALHDGKLLDVDEDHDALVRRILDREEDPIHVGFAAETPVPVRVRLPGVRTRGRG